MSPVIEMNAVYIPGAGDITSEMLADGAVTAAKIAESAVVLESNKVTGQLPGTKLADESVDASKAAKAVRQQPLIIANNEVSVTGTTEQAVKQSTFTKTPNTAWKYMVINAAIKSTNPAAKSTLNVYIDNEAQPRATLDTQLTGYDLKATSEIDVSELSNGNHSMTVKLVSDTEGATAYNKAFEAHFIR